MRRLLALLLLLPAAAIAATITWTAPTTRVDGSAITGPLTFRVYGAIQGQTKTQLGTAPGGTFVHSPPGGVTFCYAVTAVDATLAPPLESAQSAEACKAFPLSPPGAPTSVTIAVVLGINMAPVVSITPAGDRGATMLGFVPVGLECQGAPAFTYRGKTWRKVGALPVKWWASSATHSAATPCSS